MLCVTIWAVLRLHFDDIGWVGNPDASGGSQEIMGYYTNAHQVGIILFAGTFLFLAYTHE